MKMNHTVAGVLLTLQVSSMASSQDFRSDTWEATLLYKSQSSEKFGAPERADKANVNFSIGACPETCVLNV